MVIILQEAPKKKSFTQKLAGGVQAGLGLLDQMQRGSQESEALKQLTGMDLSAIQDPKIRQEAFKQAMEGKRKKELLESLGFGRGLEQKSPDKFSNKLPGEKQDKINPETGNIDVGTIGLETLPQKIPQEKINAASLIEPNLAKSWTEHNKAVDRETARKEKTQTQERQFFHKESAKFDDALVAESKAAEKKNRSLDRQLANVDKIGWWDRFISTGIAGPLTDLLRSKTAQEFDANTLSQLEGQRQLLGGVLSDSDIRLLMQKIVTASKNPEANKYIGQFMKLENEIPMLKKHIADELKSENGGYRPANYQSEIERIFDLRHGDEIKQMQQDILNLSDDTKKLNQIGRRSVPPGTFLGEDAILMYMKLSGNDPEIATEMARKDGYDVPD